MGKEIERKFLVSNKSFIELAEASFHIVQGYLNRDPHRTVRVRVKNDEAYLTIKGKNSGIERTEFEYSIPVKDALEMLKMCEGGIIDKTRYVIPYMGHNWEVDVFHNLKSPLILAEIELEDVNSKFSLPPFIGEEVSDNPNYYNSNLTGG